MNERVTLPGPVAMAERARARPQPARSTAGGRILDDLRQRILTLDLKPGAALSEKELTLAYGVSRTPLREALIRLAEEGLVEIFPQSGTFVGRIPQQALPEAVVVRKALEGAAIGYALANASDADLDRLDAVIARQEAFASIADQPGFHEADESFHATLAEIAGHPGLWRIAQQAKLQIDRCRLLTLPVPGRMRTVIGEHRDILDALRRRDQAGATEAMERHLSSVVPDAEAIRAQFPDYFV